MSRQRWSIHSPVGSLGRHWATGPTGATPEVHVSRVAALFVAAGIFACTPTLDSDLPVDDPPSTDDDDSAGVSPDDPSDPPDADNDGYPADVDCDDDDATINPGEEETCDFLDNDCDSLVDEGFDEDQDGWSTCEGDCDDGTANVFPGRPELCNGIDDDCDGIDPAPEVADVDGDGAVACHDCDDEDASTYPGAIEQCDNIDHDCDGDAHQGDPLWEADQTTVFGLVYEGESDWCAPGVPLLVCGNLGFGLGVSDVSGLHCLAEVTGSLTAWLVSSLESLHLPDLTAVGEDLEVISTSALQSIALPSLHTVGDEVRILQNDSLESVELFTPGGVGGNVSLQSNPALQSVSLAGPSEVLGDVSLVASDDLDWVSLAGIEQVGGDFEIWNNEGAIAIELPPELVSVGGTLRVSDNDDVLSLAGGDALASVGGDLSLWGLTDAVVIPAFPSLIDVGGSLFLRTGLVPSLEIFPGLQSVAGDFWVSGTAALETLTIPADDLLVGGDMVVSGHLLDPVELSISVVEVGDALDVDLVAASSFEGFAGLVSVGSTLNLDLNDSVGSVTLAALTTVGIDLNIEGGGLTSIELPSLQSVGSSLFLIHPGWGGDGLEAVSAPALVSVGDDLITYGHENLSAVDLASLESVGGQFRLDDTALTEIDAIALLADVGGHFQVSSNPQLSSIAGFSSLSSVGLNFVVTWNDTLPTADAWTLHDQVGAANIGGTAQIVGNAP